MEHTKRKILLCTFTTKDELENTIELINSTYSVVNDKIIVLYDEDDETKIFCIYNVNDCGYNTQLQKTILLHRKKETNTLYTINSLNKLILDLNGEYDTSFKIN